MCLLRGGGSPRNSHVFFLDLRVEDHRCNVKTSGLGAAADPLERSWHCRQLPRWLCRLCRLDPRAGLAIWLRLHPEPARAVLVNLLPRQPVLGREAPRRAGDGLQGQGADPRRRPERRGDVVPVLLLGLGHDGVALGQVVVGFLLVARAALAQADGRAAAAPRGAGEHEQRGKEEERVDDGHGRHGDDHDAELHEELECAEEQEDRTADRRRGGPQQAPAHRPQRVAAPEVALPGVRAAVGARPEGRVDVGVRDVQVEAEEVP
mmetsp:Transcript_31665/g.89212  ORF Transcript_31665/g.89212 Transcript_31665/m.89212 type:complete len:263 (+) Transcript_31665:141-929(+)